MSEVTRPRPGHADLVGAIRYNHFDDLRNVLERASARETAARVACGSVAKNCCRNLALLTSHTLQIGPVKIQVKPELNVKTIDRLTSRSPSVH